MTFEGMPVYPGSGEDAYARDVLPGHYKHFGADLVITLLDIWVLDPAQMQGMNVAHWMPVDCEPLSSLDRRVLDGPGRPVAFSRFGQRQLEAAGYKPFYAPHALDMSVWEPLDDRDKAREMLGFTDKFVIAINAANQDPERKGYFEQLEAFRIFSERHDDARMLIHSRVATQQGVDLNKMISELGLEGKAVPGDQYAIASGMINDAQMVSWHGVMDVLSNCSYGEGFGLAVLQSQACGTAGGRHGLLGDERAVRRRVEGEGPGEVEPGPQRPVVRPVDPRHRPRLREGVRACPRPGDAAQGPRVRAALRR